MDNQLFLNKQPILDAKQALHGYHLTLETSDGSDASSQVWEAMTKAFFADLAADLGMSNLTADKPVYYKAPIALMRLDLLPAIEPLSALTIEVDLGVLKNKVALTNLKELVKAGVKVAVADYEPSADADKLLSLAKVVKLNVKSFLTEEATGLVSDLKTKNVSVVITGLETEEQFESYQTTQAELYQGFFFTNPVFSTDKELSNNKLSLLKLLAEVNDPDIEFDQLAASVGVDVGLTHKLLTAINHPSNGIPQPVETLKEAVNYMGLKRLKFWVNMMMLSTMGDVPDELLVVALVRAKFLEGMAEKMGLNEEKDRFFMAGLFSTLNAFLKIPMIDIVDQLPLSEEVKLALVDQAGDMGRVIWVVRSLEQGNTRIDIPGREKVDLMVISSAYMAANGWAYKTIASLNS